MYKRVVAATLALATLTGGDSAYAYATTDSIPYYDQGRAYSSVLGSTDTNKSSVIISVSANYNYNNSGLGRERIRLFSKIDRIREYYPPSLGYLSWTEKMNLRFYNANQYANHLIISATDPTESTQSAPFLLNVIWDILGYNGIPTSTLQGLANNMLTKGIKVVNETGNGYDRTVLIYKPDEAKASLPDTINWYNCDASNQHSYSGVTAVFLYDLPKTATNFEVWPQGMVTYGVQYYGSIPFYVSSGAIGIKHKINKT